MKTRALMLMVAALLAADLAPLAACGDKFLGAGRGPRFSKIYAAVYPGRLLLYTPAKGDLASFNRQGLDKALRRAGHQVAVASDKTALTRVLQGQVVDVIVVDAGGADDVAILTNDMPAPPTVLPVSKETINFLRTVDDTMKARLGPKPVTAKGGR